MHKENMRHDMNKKNVTIKKPERKVWVGAFIAFFLSQWVIETNFECSCSEDKRAQYIWKPKEMLEKICCCEISAFIYHGCKLIDVQTCLSFLFYTLDFQL